MKGELQDSEKDKVHVSHLKLKKKGTKKTNKKKLILCHSLL